VVDKGRTTTQISAMNPFVILGDADVNTLARMSDLVAVIERCLQAKAEGRLVAPPRHSVAFDTGQLVFTIGGIGAGAQGGDGIAGFRAYETFRGSGSARAQLVAVWDSGSGDLRGLVVGDALGILRTARSAASPSIAWRARTSGPAASSAPVARPNRRSWRPSRCVPAWRRSGSTAATLPIARISPRA
jgi:hypothetical protein